MKTEEASSLLSSTEVVSPSSIIRSVKKEERENELEGDDDNTDNDDEENHQWIEFFENITNIINLDDEDEGNEDGDDDDRNEGVTAGRSSSSITIKTKEEVPDSIPSTSCMIEMEEEVDAEVLAFIIDNTLVWGGSTITGRVTACEGQQQVKKEEKKKEKAVAMKENDNSNDQGYASRVGDISLTTHDASPITASTNHCVRRKANSNNNKDYDDVDDERKPPPKKKIRVVAAAEEDINFEADEDHPVWNKIGLTIGKYFRDDGDGDDDDDDDGGDGDGDGISSKKLKRETKYNKGQIELWNKMFRQLVDYKEKHQTTNIPQKYKEDPQLVAWVSTQREAFNKEMISKHRMDLLDSIGFVWGINNTQWMKMYQRLITYQTQHKTTSVSTSIDPKLHGSDINGPTTRKKNFLKNR